MTVGLYAGSFDPLHLGHVGLIEVAASWCTTLYVVAAGNPDKVGALFKLPERRDLVAESVRHLPNVVALVHTGLVVDLAASLGVDVLIRGIGKEQAFEMEMVVANERMSGIPTAFVPPAAETHNFSSRLVRQQFVDRGAYAVAAMVPGPVFDALARRELSVSR